MNCDERPLLEFLRAELDARETNQTVEHLEQRQDCRERLQIMATLEAHYPRMRSRLPSWRRYWKLAAGILVATSGLLFYRLWLGEAPETQILAALATREKYPLVSLQTRSDPLQGQSEARIQAVRAYLRDDFQEAAFWFAKTRPSSEMDFYRGVSLYFLNRFPEALEHLRRAASEDPRWGDASRWYQAQVHLKRGQAVPARQLLQSLARDGEFAGAARGLLQRLPP